MKPRDEVLGVKIVGGLPEAATPRAGVSLLVELFRCSGVDGVANTVLPAKGSTKGLRQGQTVESFVLLSALGGDCIEVKRRTVLSYIEVVYPGGDVTLDVNVQLYTTK
jgi:hypothetical protein